MFNNPGQVLNVNKIHRANYFFFKIKTNNVTDCLFYFEKKL